MLIRTLIWVLLMQLSGLVLAEEGAAANVPDPLSLPGDWWTYFEPRDALDNDQFAARVDKARAFYAALRQRLAKEDNDVAVQWVDGTLADVERFAQVKSSAEPAPVPGVVLQDSYTLEEALQHFDEWWKLKRQVEAESEELAWLTALNREQRKQQSRLRGQYLEMDEQSPERLAKGLALMRKRFALETQRLDFDRRGKSLKQTQDREAAMRSELDAMPERLAATSQDLERWEGKYAEAQANVASVSGQAAGRASPGGQGEGAGRDWMEPQHMALVAVIQDLEARMLELAALSAGNTVDLIHLVLDDTGYATKAVRARIAEFEALYDVVAEQRSRLERMKERIRGSLSGVEARAPDAPERSAQAAVQKDLTRADELLRRLNRDGATDKFIVEMLTVRLYASEGWLQRGFRDVSDTLTTVAASTLGYLGATLFELNETPVTTLGLLRVLLILSIALWLSRIVRRTIKRVGDRRDGLNQSALYTFGRLMHYVILMIGIIIGLSSIGIDFTKFALFASALGVGIGFGLQTLISNFVAGLIILFEKSLKVGDFVELESGVTGEVKEINMRSTLITTNDNIDILVPNSEFVGGRVINWTLREAHRRMRVPFGVAYGTDKEKVRQAVLEAAENVPWTLKNIKNRHPQVWLVEFGDSSLNFELVVWLTPEAVKRPAAVAAAYLWEIESKLGEYGIEIPFPQRDLHLRSAFGLKDEAARGVLMPHSPGDLQAGT